MKPRTVAYNDISYAYKIILGRNPESTLDVARIYKEQTLDKFIDGLLVSDELRSKLSSSDIRASSQVSDQDLTTEEMAWLADIGLSSSTSNHMSNVETLLEAVDLLIRERLSADRVLADHLRKYVDDHPTPAYLGQPSNRAELASLRLSEFPNAFGWRAYLQRSGRRGRGRWQALRMLLAASPQADALPPLEETGDVPRFLSALALHVAGANDAYAELLLEHVRRRRRLNGAELIASGEIALRRGAPATALRSLLKAQELAPLNASAAIAAIQAATASRDVRTAKALLLATHQKLNGMPRWRAQLHAYYELRLHLAANAAYDRYRAGDRQGADAGLHELCAEIGLEMGEMEPLGVPVPAETSRRVVFLAETGLSQCNFYRVEPKLRMLPELGFQCELVSLDNVDHIIDRLIGATALLVYRLPAWPTVMRLILYARSLGVPVVFEIDDLLFDSQEYPDSLESYGGLVDEQEYVNLLFGVPLFAETVRMSDVAIASTPPLAERLSARVGSGRSQVLVNSLQPRLRSVAPPPSRSAEATVTILYGTGTRAHNSDFSELVAPALASIFAKYPNVRLVGIGHLTLPNTLISFADRIIKLEFFQSQEQYWSLLSRSDINIAVLHESPMSDCKSEIKWLEAARFGVPSIVSPTATYREALTNGKDVVFAADVAGWKAAFAELIEQPDHRRRIGRAAAVLAEQNYSNDVALEQMKSALQLTQPSDRLTFGKKRLMLVAVFFPPHTFGGATRVLKDNVDHFLDEGLLDTFDLCIVASDHDVAPEGRLRMDAYRGVPVFRISVPQHENMDWRFENPTIGSVFGRIHDLWKPDLVHFHSIQRLTGSCVEICRMSGTPYIVTAHDAWWISDHQFLVDQFGEVVNTDFGAERHLPPPNVTEAAALQRQSYLRSLLKDARLVLGVSQTFTELYQRAGVSNVETIANGVPAWPKVAKLSHDDNRVHLTHVGNVTPHKGLPLVRQVLVNSRFANLLLTVIDHSKDEGYQHEEVWGATTVRLIGPLAQADMPDFYARQHVLLAPSLWPESFGLVTREALASGLWVVASDRGAIAEDVTPGENGFVVDVSSPDALTCALAEINNDPETFRQSPPPRTLRTSAEQAEDLKLLYKSIVGPVEQAQPTSTDRGWAARLRRFIG